MTASFYQILIIAIARPYISRELPGWGHWHKFLVGDYRRDWFWNGLTAELKDKHTGYVTDVNLEKWADRIRFFLKRWHDLPAQLVINKFVGPEDNEAWWRPLVEKQDTLGRLGVIARGRDENASSPAVASQL